MSYVQNLIKTAAVGSVMAVSGAANADLVDHYQFEGNGIDSVGGNANGTVGSAVGFVAGPNGQAMSVGTSSSSSGRIDVAQASAFAPGMSDFSIAFWVKREEADTGNFDGVFDALGGGGVGYQSYFSNDNNAGGGNLDKLFIRLDDDNGNWLDCISTTAFDDTAEWHHFAMIVNRSTNTYELWADGVLDATVDISVLTGSIAPNQNLRIGQLSGSGGLDGSMDDLRFYDHALSMSEVHELAGVPAPASLAVLGLGLMASSRRRRG